MFITGYPVTHCLYPLWLFVAAEAAKNPPAVNYCVPPAELVVSYYYPWKLLVTESIIFDEDCFRVDQNCMERLGRTRCLLEVILMKTIVARKEGKS